MRKEYSISFGLVDNTCNKCEKNTNFSTNNNSSEICYNIVKVEYLHCFNRSDKLDNKVYIALTFCAFIFIFVIGLLNAIMDFKYPTDTRQLVLIVTYIGLSIITIALFIFVLIKLAILLKPIKIKSINANFITDNNLQKRTSDSVYDFETVQYVKAINENNTIFEKRFSQFAKIITQIILVVVSAFILNVIKIFININ